MSADLRTRIQTVADEMAGSVTFRYVREDLLQILEDTEPAESTSPTLANEIDSIREQLDFLHRFEEHSGVSLSEVNDRLAVVSATLRNGTPDEAAAEAAEPEQRPEPTLPRGVSAEPGTLDVGILEQSEVWKDIHGNLMWLDDMTEDHLRNVLTLLERKTVALYRLAVDKTLLLSFDPDLEFPCDTVLDYPNAQLWMGIRPLTKHIREMLG